MNITVNGNKEDIAPCSLSALLDQLGFGGRSVVVEYNRRIVKRDDWEHIQVKEDDHLEILSFVGGG